MNLEQVILYNFLTQEAFTTIQEAKAAFIFGPLTGAQYFICFMFTNLIFYFIWRAKHEAKKDR